MKAKPTSTTLTVNYPGVLLRRLRHSDADSLVRHGNNPKVAQFLQDRFPSPYTREDAYRFIEYAQGASLESIFGIEVEGEVHGVSSLLFKEDVFSVSTELGYWLSEAHWGKGIMTKVVKSLARHAFNDLKKERVYANVYDYNPASRRVLEKAGFQLEGKARNAAVKNGRLMDVWTYGCIRAEFTAH
jgi:RimJ/RimL family protein N-acetyltransferase